MPTRIVLAGFPAIPGETMLAKVAHVRASALCNDLGTMVMDEPRGYAGQFGALLTEPVTPGAVAGVIFFTPAGFGGGMCGHGTIGVVTALVEMGAVSGALPLEFVLDTPRGPVAVRANGQDDQVDSVTFRNVPGFLYRGDVTLRVPGLGEIPADICFGGNFYIYVAARDVGVRVRMENLVALRRLGTVLLQAAREQFTIESPAPWIGYPAIGAVMIRDAPMHPEAHQKNMLMGSIGFDRSPCGTGTSGWVAALHARGQLALGEEFVHESVIGSLFRGRAVECTRVGPFEAVIPEITGSAYITAFHDFIVDPQDPYRHGFKTTQE
jgi:proline racemase